MRTVPLIVGERECPISIGSGARAGIAAQIQKLSGVSKTLVIADEYVANLHLDTLSSVIGLPTAVLTFPRGEQSKSLGVYSKLLDGVADARLERNDLIITLGGGVAGDLGGFVAATWLRGIRFIQVPTTTEAAVDASVGGKTAINLPAGKNLVGAFHQPSAVIIDTDFLATLDQRDFVAGLGESVKHAAIRAPAFLTWHEDHATEILSHAPDVIADLIARNCEIKADVVGQDERERNVRAILNHGHTIGHAIELLCEYELRHGECVALGMVAENEIAERRGRLDAGTAGRIRHLLEQLGLPMHLPKDLPAEDLRDACQMDKKNVGGMMNYVLLRGLGEPVRVSDVTDAEFDAAIARISR
ncbi:MAG: 3-dehydroquinate synthase [Phycisphaerae bacterium]|nr:3-dehydroquinate synthase [Phycisphaerae bacterium]